MTSRASLVVGLAFVAFAFASCTDDVPDDKQILGIKESDESPCLTISDDIGETITSLPARQPCDTDHTHQIYAVIDMAAGPNPVDVYPGFDALEQYAQRECLDEFEPYVGISAFDSELFYSWIVPTLASWQDEKVRDREVICIAGRFDGATLDFDIQDSQF